MVMLLHIGVTRQQLSCLYADKLVVLLQVWYDGLRIIHLKYFCACFDFNPFKIISLVSFSESTTCFYKNFDNFVSSVLDDFMHITPTRDRSSQHSITV